MNDINKLLKSIRRVSAKEPVTQLQLSEIIRGLWRDPSLTSEIIITQQEHGFVVGNTIKPTTTGWVKTKADVAENAGTVCLVKEVIDADHFKIIGGGLLPGEYEVGAKYFLSSEFDGEIIASAFEDFGDGEFVEFIGTGSELGLFIEIDFGFVKQTVIQPTEPQEYDVNATTWIDDKIMTVSQTPAPTNAFWTDIDCSDNGQIIIACIGGPAIDGYLTTGVYVSKDGGDSWARKYPGGDYDFDWNHAKCNLDGSVMYVCNTIGGIYRSYDQGDTWTLIQPVTGSKDWTMMNISSSGIGIIVGWTPTLSGDGKVYKSENSGDSWIELTGVGALAVGRGAWLNAAINDDFDKMIIQAYEKLFISNAGNDGFIDYWQYMELGAEEPIPSITGVNISADASKAIVAFGMMSDNSGALIQQSYIQYWLNGMVDIDNYRDSFHDWTLGYRNPWMSRNGDYVATLLGSNLLAIGKLRDNGDFTYHKLRFSDDQNGYLALSSNARTCFIAQFGKGILKVTFEELAANDHNSLNGLEGGDPNSNVYLHLRPDEIQKLNNLPNPEDIYEYWVLGGKIPSIGEEYGGGIVFYVADDQSYILVCATEDIGDKQRWCLNDQNINPFLGINGLENLDYWPNSNTLQSGAINTNKIITALDALGQTGYAAKLCREYMGGGFMDWYLPTSWELDFMLRNLKDFANNFHSAGYTSISDCYWSSSSSHDNIGIYRIAYNYGNPSWNCYAPDYNWTGQNAFDARWGYVRPVRRIQFQNLQIRNKENLEIKSGEGINVELNGRVMTISTIGVATSTHDHDLGDLTLLFENNLV